MVARVRLPGGVKGRLLVRAFTKAATYERWSTERVSMFCSFRCWHIPLKLARTIAPIRYSASSDAKSLLP